MRRTRGQKRFDNLGSGSWLRHDGLEKNIMLGIMIGKNDKVLKKAMDGRHSAVEWEKLVEMVRQMEDRKWYWCRVHEVADDSLPGTAGWHLSL